MTTEFQQLSVQLKPLLLRFSEPISQHPPVRVRYDPVRQISLIETDGIWIDATAVSILQSGTRVTRVAAETTDDN